jgi:hypothetical protein
VVILGQILFNFLTPERRTSKIHGPGSNERRQVHSSQCSIVVRFAGPLSPVVRRVPGISFQQHERRSQAFRRNGHPTRCFPCQSSGRTCAGVLTRWPTQESIFTRWPRLILSDHTVVCTVVSDPTKALMLLGEAGVLALETYLAAGREAEKGLIILRPSDVERARCALEEL